ncbi:MAG: bifunctional 3-deoxy-7-phosphoheptulonate synthase/chorismate mutase type II [Bacteroidia bacterium]|nr:bifunctional 3-deoxy-7-phosphoheptulonate synthase/chorismate mutase type II [Bacteroidia bacterium]
MAKKFDIVPLSEWGFFTLPRPCTIAGPCSAESEEQVMETARQLRAVGINVFRAGIWKPRTRPGCFEGVGVPGLKWLQRVQNELGMKVCTEVASERHIFECLKHGIDMVWIGARTSANPFLMQEIADALADTDIPVLVKNPVNPDLSLWMGALERLNNAGVRKLGVIHRGFSSINEKRLRNSPQWQIAIELRSRIPDMPFFCDPSHMAGCKEFIPELSQRAMNLGLDGLMIESHCNPSCALSDASQQLTPTELINLLESLSVRDNDTLDVTYKENMEQLRAQIDEYDSELLRLLSGRMSVSRKMGEYKKKNNVAILQTGRWDAVMEKMRQEAALCDLDPEFVATIWNAIHEASVKEQNLILGQD